MLTVSDYCKNKYGEKLYKISLSGGFTCPNRDGTLGNRGCIFCSEGGSGDFAESASLSVAEQIDLAKMRLEKKFHGNHYIAYFQAYTNTYASLEYLKSLYDPVADREDIKVISIATRPDCLPKEALEYLGELQNKKDLWVELGFQSCNEKSVKYIRRGYENEVYKDAISRLNELGIHTITHIIVGLPGETKEDVIKSVRYAVAAGTKGIKLQLLHVLKGTDLADDYEKGLFKVLEEDEYFDIIKACLKEIPNDVVIHRLSGDGPKSILIAPMWSANKREVLNRINKLKSED